MLVKCDYIPGLRLPTSETAASTVITIASAKLPGRVRLTATQDHVGLRKIMWIDRFHIAPAGHQQMEIIRNFVSCIQPFIDELIAFCKAKELAMRVVSNGLDHAAQIICIKDVPGYMKTKPFDFLTGCIDFVPIYIRLFHGERRIDCIRRSNSGAKIRELRSIAKRRATFIAARRTGQQRQQRNAGDGSHFTVGI